MYNISLNSYKLNVSHTLISIHCDELVYLKLSISDKKTLTLSCTE